MSPGRVNQIIGELRALTNDKDRPQDEVMTLAVAIRLLESQQLEIASHAQEVREAVRDASAEAMWNERESSGDFSRY